MKSEGYRNKYNQHLLHPWGDLSTLGDDDSSSVIVKGEGVYIYDAEGNRLLDDLPACGACKRVMVAVKLLMQWLSKL